MMAMSSGDMARSYWTVASGPEVYFAREANINGGQSESRRIVAPR